MTGRKKGRIYITVGLAAVCVIIAVVVTTVVLSNNDQGTQVSNEKIRSAAENNSDNEADIILHEDTLVDEQDDYTENEDVNETKSDSQYQYSSDGAPVGRCFYREITEDFIYKQSVVVNADGTITIVEDEYSTNPNDRVDGGRIFRRYYLSDDEAIWNSEENNYTVRKNVLTGDGDDSTTNKEIYEITFLSDEHIRLECHSTRDEENADFQRINGEYYIKK